MPNKWLRSLENERQRSLSKLAAVCEDEEAVNLAAKEIELNYMSVRKWLVRLYERGYKVNDDLSRSDRDYDASEAYRRLMNHVEHHLRKLRYIPIEAAEGCFEPALAKFY